MRAMKDSGVEWLGQVPEGWDIVPLSMLFWQRTTKVSDEDYRPLSVTMNGVVPQLETAAKSDDHTNRKFVCAGDFAINSRSDRRNSCGFAAQDGSVSLINTICVPRGSFDTRYYGWLFKTSQWADGFYSYGHGIVDDLWTTGWNDMRKILMPLPPLEEQRRIADYLDERCAAIDAAIDAAKASIEDCKAYRASLIAETMTRGLDPNAPLKDSGVEWLGQVPEGWKIGRAKDAVVLHHGSDPQKEGDTPVYGSGETSFKTCGESKQGPTVLLGRKGTIGVPQYIEGSYWNVDTAFDAKPRSENYNLKFFYYYSSCVDCGPYQTQAAVPSMNQSAYYSIPMPLPPLEEQRRIVDYLDERCAAIDAVIEKNQAIIDELGAYRKSLIYEIVTGKREV